MALEASLEELYALGGRGDLEQFEPSSRGLRRHAHLHAVLDVLADACGVIFCFGAQASPLKHTDSSRGA